MEKESVLYVVDRFLLQRCGAITVDWAEEDGWSGFALIARYPLLGGC